MNPRLSVIIPTHNRASQLQRGLVELLKIVPAETEVVVVDNNSSDATRQVTESFDGRVRYVLEPRTSSARARHTGAVTARGEFLLFIDDDVEVAPGSLEEIIRLFSENQSCGMIAGRIDPRFVTRPPVWCLECQKLFNAWSLFNEDTIAALQPGIQEVAFAYRPMMAVRRSAYDQVGGFPPDTVSLGTTSDGHSLRKLHLGPGDVGFSALITAHGHRILYSPAVRCVHAIPPLRFSMSFWRSRAIGEGLQFAASARCFYNHNVATRILERNRRCFALLRAIEVLEANLQQQTPGASEDRVWPEELVILLESAFLNLDGVLENHPDLARLLWKVASEGVEGNQFAPVVAGFPEDLKTVLYGEPAREGDTIRTGADIIACMQTMLLPSAQAHVAAMHLVYEELRAVHGPGALPPLHEESNPAILARLIAPLLEQQRLLSAEMLQWAAAALARSGQHALAVKLLEKTKGSGVDHPFNAALLAETKQDMSQGA